MKKSNLITGILYVLFGVACLIVALLIETKLEGILWGFAGAGIFPGIMMICKYFYWSSPKNKERYEERLENERIEQHDELKTKIRDRAGRYTYSLGLLVVCFSILVFGICFSKLAGGEQHFMLFADSKSTRDRRTSVARECSSLDGTK